MVRRLYDWCPMSLEQKVRQEVDTWQISLRTATGHRIEYEPLIKPLYYGIGIIVTEQGVRLYEQKWNELQKQNKRVQGISTVGDVVKETIKRVIDKPFSAISFDVLAAMCAAKFCGKMPEPANYTIYDAIITEKLADEIKKYAKIVPQILLKRLIEDYAGMMAGRFAVIAKECVQFPTDHAEKTLDIADSHQLIDTLKTEYYRQQFIAAGFDGHKAAERCGVNYNAFKVYMSERGLSMIALRVEHGRPPINPPASGK